MAELILWELKKLLKSKITIVCVMMCLLLIILTVISNQLLAHVYYTYDSSVYPPVRSVVRGMDYQTTVRSTCEPFIGRKVDETFVNDILDLFKFDNGIAYANDAKMIMSPLYGFVRFGVSVDGVQTVLPVSEWLANSEDAPIFFFTTGWEEAFNYLIIFGYAVIFVCVAITASVFSNEYACGSDALILTAKYGKNKCAAAKIIVLFSVCLLLTVLLCTLLTVSITAFYSFEGYDADIRIMSGLKFCAYSGTCVSCVGLCAITIAVICCAALIACSLTVFISSICPSVFASVISGIGLCAFPAFVNAVLPETIITAPAYLKIYSLFPTGALTAPSGGWYTLEYVGIPYILILFVFMLILCTASSIGAYTAFKRHQVK